MQSRFFPYEAKLGRVMGVLRLLHNRKGRMELRELPKITKLNHDSLIPIIRAAQMIGAVEVHGEEIVLTEIGERLDRMDKGTIRMVGEKLREMQPFKESLILARRKGYFTIDDLEAELNKSGVMLHSDLLTSKSLLSEELIQWTIFFNLLYYNSKERRWLKSKV